MITETPTLRTYMVDSTDLGDEPPTTLELLRELVKDGEWHTTSEILGVGGHRSGLRRLRELRKEFEIDRRSVDGDSEYKVLGNRLNLDVSRTALTHTLALLETTTSRHAAGISAPRFWPYGPTRQNSPLLQASATTGALHDLSCHVSVCGCCCFRVLRNKIIDLPESQW